MFLFTGTTYYNIHVAIGSVNWTVRHRYKEFVELHSKLVSGQSISRDLLPPKKVCVLPLSHDLGVQGVKINKKCNSIIAGHWQSIDAIS